MVVPDLMVATVLYPLVLDVLRFTRYPYALEILFHLITREVFVLELTLTILVFFTAQPETALE